MADLVTVKLTGFDGLYQLLLNLPPEVVSKRGGPVKSGLRKGALVILKAELIALDAAIASSKSKEERDDTGLLKGAVIATRGKPPADGKGERYLVRVKNKAYVRAGKAVTTLKTAQLKEYGSHHQAPAPWIRPAFLANAEEAIQTIETETLAGVDRVVKKYLKTLA